MFGNLNTDKLEKYISSLYLEEHLEIIQCTYTLSKVKKIELLKIKKLVVTNPYTKGLKELMFAFNEDDSDHKIKNFELALKYLSHIKYYYLEALYYYCIFLFNTNDKYATTINYNYSENLIFSWFPTQFNIALVA